MRRAVAAGLLALMWGAAACTHRAPAVVAPSAPRYPGVVQPDVPQALSVAPAVRQRFDQAWARFQAGDARAAARDLSDLLKQSPSFYPAEAALGELALVDKDFKSALAYFTSVAEKNDRYLPALEGRVQAALGVGDDGATA